MGRSEAGPVVSGSESKSSTTTASSAGGTRTGGVHPASGLAARIGRRGPKDPDSLWGPRYRTETTVFAALIFLVGFAALALVTCLPLAAAGLHGQNLYRPNSEAPGLECGRVPARQGFSRA